MYVCLCNNLKSSELCDAAQQSCRSVSALFKHFGCQPVCGKCVPYMRESVLTASDGSAA